MQITNINIECLESGYLLTYYETLYGQEKNRKRGFTTKQELLKFLEENI